MLALAIAAATTGLTMNALLPNIFRGYWILGAVNGVAFGVLSLLALNEFGYFRVHYPFSNPIAIAFPFPNQNVAAPYIGLCLLSVLGGSYYIRRTWITVFAVGSLVFAAAMTGSRANLLFVSISSATFLIGAALFTKPEWTSGEQRKATWLGALTLGFGAGIALIFLHQDWQPVARSTSIYEQLLKAPGVMLAGGEEGAPRRELWERAIKNAHKARPYNSDHSEAGNEPGKRETSSNWASQEGSDESTEKGLGSEHGIALVTVSNGCKVRTEPIYGLRTGNWYVVALDFTPTEESGHARITVRDKVGRRVIETESEYRKKHFKSIFVMASDSNRRKVIAAGEITKARIKFGRDAFERPLLEDQESLEIHQEEHNGGLGNVVSLRPNSIDFDAQTRIFRGVVLQHVSPEVSDRIRLEYEFRLARAEYSLPVHPPVIFYTGFANTRSSAKWHELRDAILIQHVRKPMHWEPYHLASQAVEELVAGTQGTIDTERAVGLVHQWESAGNCGLDDHMPLRSLWSPPIDWRGLAERLPNFFGGRVKASTHRAGLSVLPDPSWSVDQHLSHQGSTHNAFLDWYVYEGPLACSLFIVFIGGHLYFAVRLGWRHRRGAAFPLLLACVCQLLLLCGTLYAQPYIWVRYIWVILGVTGALILHLSFKRHDEARI